MDAHRVKEDGTVAAPKGLGRFAADHRAGGTGLLDQGVDLRWRTKR
jgi:hypothetical protein